MWCNETMVDMVEHLRTVLARDSVFTYNSVLFILSRLERTQTILRTTSCYSVVMKNGMVPKETATAANTLCMEYGRSTKYAVFVFSSFCLVFISFCHCQSWTISNVSLFSVYPGDYLYIYICK